MNISIPLFSLARNFSSIQNPTCNYKKLNFHFSAEFISSTRRLPAAARRRTEVHRVRAVRQEQRSNRNKEPLKTNKENMQNKPNLNT